METIMIIFFFIFIISAFLFVIWLMYAIIYTDDIDKTATNKICKYFGHNWLNLYVKDLNLFNQIVTHKCKRCNKSETVRHHISY